MTLRRRLLPIFLLLVAVTTIADDAKPTPAAAELAAADQLFQAGKYPEAADKYQAILKSEPKLVAAQAGLIRSLLRDEKVEDAFTIASSDIATEPNAAALRAAMGDVQFRRGEIRDAEISYLKALELDHSQVWAYLGLSQLYDAYSLHRQAYLRLQQAHQLAPNDPEVQLDWLDQLPRKERVGALERYLAGPHPDNAEETKSLQHYLDDLKANLNKPPHACKLVSKGEQTDIRMERVLGDDDPPTPVGYALVVKLNDHNLKLQLDTGASGILVGRHAAEKAGLTRISDYRFGGIGDKGLQDGYLAVAEHIRVGALEFQDCVVGVSDRRSVMGEDGLIGADVFQHYLIDIDMPEQKLRLSPLPKRPDETEAAPTLNSNGDEDADEESAEPASSPPKPADSAGDARPATPRRVPQDRYVAPEMAKWTLVFRFGHALLIPTHVNNSAAMLFLIDTGADGNVISKRAAKQVTKINLDADSYVQGLSGTVNDVYTANKVTLHFDHLDQKNQGITTFDLSTLSADFGTEISGLLGFDTLHLLQIKIDYRDGLVDFVYDAKRWEH